ncbi:MAG: hypothetical protein WB919_21410, partial [Candidatus Sulfotelmatobacter sp.]
MSVAQVHCGQPLENLDAWTSGISGLRAHAVPNRAAEQILADQVLIEVAADEIDPLYLFACQMEWEQRAEPGAGWEVISAARSANQNTRAHSRSLLERMLQPRPDFSEVNTEHRDGSSFTKEADMR